MSRDLSRAVRWPLWSWRNLTVSAVALLALLAFVGNLTDGSSSASTSGAAPGGTATAPTAPSTPASTATTVSPSATGTPAPPTASSTVAQGSATAVAGAFVAAWAQPDAAEAAWLEAMRPWATPKLLASFAGADPRQVPATRLTGDPALARTTASAATVTVPTDGGTVEVSLERSGAAWRAGAIAPADAPPGAETPSLGPAPAGATGG